MKLDTIDFKLLEILQKDSSLTIKQLASKLNLTPSPIHERIKKLEKAEIISGYKATVNRKKIGKEIMVFCQVSIKDHSKENLLHFEGNIKTLKEVIACYHVSGQYDYVLTVVENNMDEYRDFITNKLAKISNIDNVYSTFIMEEVKTNGVISS